MSIKLINSARQDMPRVEVRLKGPGATTVGLYDSKGNALLTKRLILSGPNEVEARSLLPLILQTKAGQVPLVPMLIHQTNRSQAVTFAGQDPAMTTAERCHSMKLNKSSISKIHVAVQLAREQMDRSFQGRQSFRRDLPSA
jgi:hypothetical protein